VRLTGEEVRQLARLLDGVMTLASHGILFRFGQGLAAGVLDDAKGRGGDLEEAAFAVLAARGWVVRAEVFRARILVEGSIEASESPGGEPTCHLLRGILHKVVEASRGPHAVREVECRSSGAKACVFEAVKGGALA
jgi:predicted hydrocarbon binding protein